MQAAGRPSRLPGIPGRLPEISSNCRVVAGSCCLPSAYFQLVFLKIKVSLLTYLLTHRPIGFWMPPELAGPLKIGPRPQQTSPERAHGGATATCWKPQMIWRPRAQ